MSGPIHTLDFDHVWRVVKDRIAWLLVPLLIAPIAAYAAGLVLAPVFKSRARVLVQDAKATNPFLEDILVDWSAKRRGTVIISVLKSRPTMERVLRAVGEIHPDDPPERVSQAVLHLAGRMSVIGLGAGVVQIDLRGDDPDWVKAILDELVEAFVREMLRPQKQALEEATTLLRSQTDRLRGELAALEGELVEFKRTHADELPDVYRLNLDAQLVLRKQLVEAEAAVEHDARRHLLVQERLAALDPVLLDLERKLVKQRAEMAELSATYTAEHAEVKVKRQKIATLSQQIARRRANGRKGSLRELNAMAAEIGPDGQTNLMTADLVEFKAAASQVESNKAAVELLRTRVKEGEKTLGAFAQNEQALTRLERELGVKSQVYRDLLTRHEDALVSRALAMGDEKSQVWLIEPPRRPTRPSGPGVVIRVVGGLFGGLFLGLFAIGLAEFRSPTVRRPSECEALVGAPVIGRLGPVERL